MESAYTPEYYRQKQLATDIRFLKIAKLVGESSKCLSRKIGSVIVRNGNIVSEGKNGPPKRTKHCNERLFDMYDVLNCTQSKPLLKLKPKNDQELERFPQQCPRKEYGYKSGEGLLLCSAQHSEENAINQAALNGVSTLGTTLYAYCCLPCKNCMGSIINAGIKEVVCLKVRPDYDSYNRILAEEAGIIVREIEESLIC
jgi:dCMP deaminase